MPRAPRTLADIPVPEASIQAGIITLLQLDGWRVFETDKQRWQETRAEHPLGGSEVGMPDVLAIRYCYPGRAELSLRKEAEVCWIECKRFGGKAAAHQKLWHSAERARGAFIVLLGEDCAASIDGWIGWYERSGLQRRAQKEHPPHG